ncbi:MAG: hypothetical protein M9894_16055 [Planctomycetes bacterium]|nr:hypothetical protein [Planctomycetota bacterium]
MSDAHLRQLERELAADPTPVNRDRLATERARRGDGPWLPALRYCAPVAETLRYTVTPFARTSPRELRTVTLEGVYLARNVALAQDQAAAYAALALSRLGGTWELVASYARSEERNRLLRLTHIYAELATP